MTVEDRRASLNACYARALRRLRDAHDKEFRTLLAEEYESAGVTISMRASRLEKSRSKE